MDSRPIGVFDSGIGGLTVVKEIMEQLPNESIVYFGDTARVPYGTKSKETVTKYSFQCINFLLEKKVKAIVVACNTASAASLDAIKQSYDIPIVGVVEPGAIAACEVTKLNKIGIIGTEGTVSSGAYEKEINIINNDVKMVLKACPLFVPIVEEGWQDTEIAKLTAKEYLEGLKGNGIDALVMACTHYPLLEQTIGEIMGEDIQLVNPAFETAKALKTVLHELNIHSKSSKSSSYEFYVSDNPVKFKKVGENFLKKPISHVQKIDIEKY
ncbi:MAG: murI [Clostridia bacterium]|jgi:glutamate racemase|nr:murI [Clostridia bacterium]